MEWTESSKHPECSKCLEMGNQFKSIICCSRGELIQTKRLYLNMRRGIAAAFKCFCFRRLTWRIMSADQRRLVVQILQPSVRRLACHLENVSSRL